LILVLFRRWLGYPNLINLKQVKVKLVKVKLVTHNPLIPRRIHAVEVPPALVAALGEQLGVYAAHVDAKEHLLIDEQLGVLGDGGVAVASHVRQEIYAGVDVGAVCEACKLTYCERNCSAGGR
jgi:hypothetical protein